jgi:hypothetical protein
LWGCPHCAASLPPLWMKPSCECQLQLLPHLPVSLAVLPFNFLLWDTKGKFVNRKTNTVNSRLSWLRSLIYKNKL